MGESKDRFGWEEQLEEEEQLSSRSKRKRRRRRSSRRRRRRSKRRGGRGEEVKWTGVLTTRLTLRLLEGGDNLPMAAPP